MVPNAHLIKKFHNGSQMFKIIATIWKTFGSADFWGPTSQMYLEEVGDCPRICILDTQLMGCTWLYGHTFRNSVLQSKLEAPQRADTIY